LDYFPSDFILFIDESHATIPQLRGMWGGDRARKQMLISYGFRLPSAMDNRPLRFDEFESIIQQHIYVSATPSDYELEKTGGVIVEQLVRPTGLLDPPISVRPSLNQIDDLLEEIKKRTELNQRVLVTTLTKRMTEELTKYFQKLSIKVKYIHSEVDTMERVEILRDLQLGEFDVLVGVNLLREGLDLPEVSLVAILDADKEGFLRNQRSLTQTAGRAARNVDGLVIFYADKMTDSMQRTIDETLRRRAIQMQYNENHGVTPRTVTRSRAEIIAQSSILDIRGRKYDAEEITPYSIAAETEVVYSSKSELKKQISAIEKKMREAAKILDFITAAQLRDESLRLKKQLEAF
jgi:excinuclease ABC subunit B